MTEKTSHVELTSTWDLGVNRFAFERAANAWETIGKLLSSRADNLASRSGTLLGSDWSGESRNAYEDYRKSFISTLDKAESLATTYSGRLHDLAGAAASTESALRTNFGNLPAEHVEKKAPFGILSYYEFTFEPEVADSFHALIQEAHALKQDYFEYQGKIFDGPEEWEALLTEWQSRHSDPTGLSYTGIPYTESATTQVLMIDGEVVISTGGGSDLVEVTQDNEFVRVTVNGVVYSYSVGTPITIFGGGGDDTIKVADDVRANLTILGAAGDDTIIAGGEGERTVIGGSGDDRISGGTGDDYLSGGRGRDYLEGHDGDDVIVGGPGSSVVYGGEGRDVISSSPEGYSYVDGGPGADQVFGAHEWNYITIDDQDSLIHPDPDRVEVVRSKPVTDLPFITIEGSPEFIARVESDLASLNGSGNTLERLSEHHNGNFLPGGHRLVIREAEPNASTLGSHLRMDAGGNYQSVINYNPVPRGDFNPPHHELRSALFRVSWDWEHGHDGSRSAPLWPPPQQDR